jgi:hypothetical protein
LKYDAERDLYDIGAQFIAVHALNKVPDKKNYFSIFLMIEFS